MGRGKIVDEAEVRRWYEDEQRTFAWMAAEYIRKYDIQISPTAFSERARTRGWTARNVRDDNLIPWAVNPCHKYDHVLTQLRTEARVRNGKRPEDLSYALRTNWTAFHRRLAKTDSVVHYEPDRGFLLVPREPGDDDIIRRPTRGTTRRPRRAAE